MVIPNQLSRQADYRAQKIQKYLRYLTEIMTDFILHVEMGIRINMLGSLFKRYDGKFFCTGAPPTYCATQLFGLFSLYLPRHPLSHLLDSSRALLDFPRALLRAVIHSDLNLKQLSLGIFSLISWAFLAIIAVIPWTLVAHI
ncbi:hypothetical protein AD939_01505 [Gluconobacter oxydans]|nr:hypothetical protein AD939_01505 [Gluconobacter oxydans]